MPTGLVNNAISNNIEWATHNGKGLITGKRKDVTQEAIKVMFSHMLKEFERNESCLEKGYFGYKIKGIGVIKFFPE